jgi:hypothetical protein
MNDLRLNQRVGVIALPLPNPLPQAGEGANVTLRVFRIFSK